LLKSGGISAALSVFMETVMHLFHLYSQFCPLLRCQYSMEKHLLIIDDDDKLNRLLSDYLPRFGYRVTTATHPQDGLQLIRTLTPDLLILDVMLPGMDGFELLKRIRMDSDVPVLMLTARGDVTDRVVGLELGADDYLPKPFEPRELVARIQSVLRRHRSESRQPVLRSGEPLVDTDKHQATLNGIPLDLTTFEFELLVLLLKNKGRVLSREAIMERTHNMDWEAFNRTVDVLISRLRGKLGEDPRHPRFIKTIWGKGYKFVGDEHA
jgi:DNA-binding response OmpR family regulator